jgi:hypothetical protein
MAGDHESNARPRVVVTGVGSVSALGAGGGAAVGAALTSGRPAIGPIRAFPTDARARLAARSATSRPTSRTARRDG